MPQVITAQMVATMLISFAASTLLSKVMAQEPEDGPKGIQTNTRSSQEVIPLLYGESRVGTNVVFIGTTGSSNKYLHMVCGLGEGPIEGLRQVDGVDQVFLDDKIYTQYGGNVYYELFTGSSTQTVCSTLQTAIPEWTDPLKYTAYLYVRLKYDMDYFQGIPDVTVGVEGLNIYNPTTTTTAYNNTPALCAYDMLTRPSTRGGMGIASSRINTTALESTRSYCVSKGWTCNMPVLDNDSIADNIIKVLTNCRGEVVYTSNEFAVTYRDLNDEIVSMTFDDAEGQIVAGSLTVNAGNVFDMANAVKVQYLAEQGENDGASTYKRREYIQSDNDVVTLDGDYREFTIECLGLSDLDTVQKMAYYYAERERLKKTFSFGAGSRAAILEPNDLIKISHSMPGWSEKYGRVQNVSLNPDNTVTLSCVEEHLDFYDDVYDPQSEEWYDTTLPSHTDEPHSVINVSHSEENYAERGRSRTRWVISFDPPSEDDDPFFQDAKIYIKIGDGDYTYMTRSASGYVVDPVQEGVTYSAKIVSVNVRGVSQRDENAYKISKTIAGKTEAPSSLSSMTAVANGDSVSVFADPISDDDVDGYEVRLGDAFYGGLFIFYGKAPSLGLNGVRPGTHTFHMDPKDNAGNYSGSPVSATCKVFVPPGYSELTTYGSWSWDFTSTGKFVNTEHTTYDGVDALICSHDPVVVEDDFDGYTDTADFVANHPFTTVTATSTITFPTGLDGTGQCIQAVDTGTTNTLLMAQNIYKANEVTVKYSFSKPDLTNTGLMMGPSIQNQDFDTNVQTIISATHIQTWDDTTLTNIMAIAIDTVYDIEVVASIDTQTHVVIVDGVEYGPYAFKNGSTAKYFAYVKIQTNTAHPENIKLDDLSIEVNPLTGVWKSPVYNLTAVEDVRIWGDFLTAFSSSDTTWAGVAPSPTTWADLSASTSSWADVTALSQGGSIQATLYYSDDGTTYSSADFFEILSAEVTASHVYVIVTITDPTQDSQTYLKELNMSAYEGPQ